MSSTSSTKFSAPSAQLFLVFLALGGCAGREPLSLPNVAELDSVPFFAQTEFECGPAALATLLVHQDIAITPEALAPAVYVAGLRGSLQAELLAATRRQGMIPYLLEPDPERLLAEVADGRPVLVMQNLGLKRVPVWHYAVVIGYDAADDRVILRSGAEARRLEKSRRFLRSWTLAERWAFVAARPGDIPVTARPERYVRALIDAAALLTDEMLDAGHAGARQRWPDTGLVWFAAANHAQSRRQWQEAARLFRRALELDPGDVAARNNFAYTLFEAGCHDEALREAETALATLEPGEPFYAAIQDTVRDLSQRAPPTRECTTL